MKFLNQVKYIGKIVEHKSFNKEYDRLTVLSKNGKDIYVSFLCKKSKLDNIQDGRVTILGHIESRPEKLKNGTYARKQHFYVDVIEMTPTMLDSVFGVKGKFYPVPAAEVYIAGELKEVKKENNWYRYTVEIENVDKAKSTIMLSQPELDRHPKLNPGDNICCVCNISTPRKTVESNIRVHYEDLLVSDLAIVS